MKAANVLFSILFLLAVAACAPGQTTIAPPEIRYGETVCDECNMILSDPRFAAGYAYEVAPGRYLSIPFDDVGEMVMKLAELQERKVVAWYVNDYTGEEWLDATQSFYVQSVQIRSPMGFGIAAHATQEAAEAMAAETGGELLHWNGLLAKQAAGDLLMAAAMEHDAAEHAAMHAETDSGMRPGEEIIVGEAAVEGMNLQVVAHAPLHAGYNDVMVHLTDAEGEPVEDAQISYAPTMNMLDGGHHGSGVITPTMAAPGMYHGAVIFSMPGGPELGSWTLNVGVIDPATGVAGEAAFEVDVAPSKRIASFMAPGERKIFLALVEPQTPEAGLHPIRLIAMEKKGMFDWPLLDGLTLEIKPWMPTMDHGSGGNENPVFQDGSYLGKVNFTMPGPWTLTVTAKENDTTLGEIVFEFEVR